jgi:prophage regulatory protein
MHRKWVNSDETRYWRARPVYPKLAKPIVSIARLQMPAMTTIKSFLKQSHSGVGESEAPSASSPPANTFIAPIHILRLAQVIERTGLKKTTIYELQSEGQFPMRVKITAHAVGWIEHEVHRIIRFGLTAVAPDESGSRSTLTTCWTSVFDQTRLSVSESKRLRVFHVDHQHL